MAKVTVMEYERVVKLVDGQVKEVLGPGRHAYRRRRTVLHRVDMRPRWLTVAGQEVLTADGISVKVTAVLLATPVDPVADLTVRQVGSTDVYIATQHALRLAVARQTLEALMESRLDLSAELEGPVREAAARVGLEVNELIVRDLMLPGDLRRAFAEVLLAQQQGKAELEKARAEAASLRLLANTADLLEKHPSLLELRTLQTAETGELKLVIKK
ncbi:MAG TPA: slipin family protein [Candidatus Limnocylindrales bacterium]|nr:slipin family protein [Candidatus Limnocylindrales bacterium]